jgi:hypothetical protein
MKKRKRQQRALVPQMPETDTDDEAPSLLTDRLMARRKRARGAVALRKKLINASLKQLGVTREALEKQADDDFARAKAESKARLLKQRKLHAAKRKQRGTLRSRIEAAFARFGELEALR